MPQDANQLMSTTARKSRYFFGWNVVIASAISQVAYFHHLAASLGLFLKPLQTEFGWSRSALAGVQTTGRVLEGVAAPIVGPLVDRYGPRVLMPIGGIILTLSLLGTVACNNIWQLYLFRGILASIGFALIGDVVTGVTISKWFVKKRGRAVGFSRTASMVAGIVITPLTVYVIAGPGWRMAFVMYAVFAFVFAVMPPLFLMRRSPEDLGLLPDGIDASGAGSTSLRKGGEKGPQADGAHMAPEPLWSRGEALRTGSFWMISAAFAINVLAFQSINMSLAAYVEDVGHGAAMVGAVMSGRFVIQSVAAFFMGYLAEYADRVAIRIVPFLLQGLGAYLFIYAADPFFLWLALAFFSMGQSGALVLQEVVYANFFGRKSLGAIRSMGYFVIFVPGAMGPVAMNAVFDMMGSYRAAFEVLVGLFALASFMLGVARPPKAKRYATPEAQGPATSATS